MQVSINNSLWRLSVPFTFLTLGCAKHSRWPQYEGIWRGSQPGCGNRQAKRPFWYSWSLLSKREVSKLMSSQVGGRGHPEAVTRKRASCRGGNGKKRALFVSPKTRGFSLVRTPVGVGGKDRAVPIPKLTPANSTVA